MLTRRRFLQVTSSTFCLTAAPAFLRGQNLNSRLQVAGVGCNGKGWSDIKEVSTHPQVDFVAFCDVDLGRTENVRKLNPAAPIFQDYRELLEEAGSKFDAVTVGTPDHMHAPISLAAMQKGKHVYCEKPLTHTVEEARQMANSAAKHGVITRMGNQIHSRDVYRTAVALVQQGTIGKVQRVHSWCNAKGHGYAKVQTPPESTATPPADFNWDLWLGVAPARPYVPTIYHPFNWRDWQDFGNGALGDFGCHILDPVFTALKIKSGPKSLQARSTPFNTEIWPEGTDITYVFPGTEWTAGDELVITWNDGVDRPKVDSLDIPEGELPKKGSLLVGERGILLIPHVGAPKLYPTADFPQQIAMEQNVNHYRGWAEGCLTGKQPSDGFDEGGRLTEAVLLGNIAIRYPGEVLQWDEKKLKITNNDDANRWIRKPYREGWKLKADA